jgi:hypothetical protein
MLATSMVLATFMMLATFMVLATCMLNIAGGTVVNLGIWNRRAIAGKSPRTAQREPCKNPAVGEEARAANIMEDVVGEGCACCRPIVPTVLQAQVLLGCLEIGTINTRGGNRTAEM